jgi:hypothetical protein
MELTGSALFGLGARTGLKIAEEVGFQTAEVVAQDAKGAGSVAETKSDLVGGGSVDKEGPKSLVLAVGWGRGFEEELGIFC